MQGGLADAAHTVSMTIGTTKVTDIDAFIAKVGHRSFACVMQAVCQAVMLGSSALHS